MFTALRAMAVDTLPKGVGPESLHAVVAELRRSGAMSATQAGEVLGTSRVTARRYLEYLTESGLAERRSRYGGAGRPEVEYRWRATTPRRYTDLRRGRVSGLLDLINPTKGTLMADMTGR